MNLNDIEVVLRSLVLSSPQDLTVGKLCKDFEDQMGYSIPYKKFGYVSLESLLSSLYHSLVLLKKNGITYIKAVPSSKTTHIEYMIATQNKRRKNKFSSHYNSKQHTFQGNMFQTKKATAVYPDINMQLMRHTEEISLNRIEFDEVKRKNRLKFGANYNEKSQKYDNVFDKVNNNVDLKDQNKKEKHVTMGNVTNKNEVKSTPKAVYFSPSNHYEGDSFGDDLKRSCEALGRLCLEDSSQIATQECSKQLIDDYNKFHVDYSENSSSVNLGKNKLMKCVKLGNVTYINEVEHIIKSTDFTTEQHYNENILPNDLKRSCNDFEKLCSENSKGIYSITQEPECSGLNTSTCDEEEVSIFKDHIPVFLDDFPKNVALPGDKIPLAVHMSDLEIGSMFCIYISEVHNPFKLWFHIEKVSKELDELMLKIELFYKQVGGSKEYNMHLSNMNPNQLCVALYNNYWHRATVLQNPINDLVRVYFVDYGTVDNIPTSSLKYLHKDFIKVPSQVYRGCLAFLKPVDIYWHRDCTYALLSIVYEKKLWAKLEDFDRDDYIYHISVVDTGTNVDININKSLIMKGHANACSINKVKTQPQYLYPTFDMLENADYPSFEEIGKLLAKNNNFEEEEYKTLKSINPQKLYNCSTLEFWNFIKKF